MDSTAALTGPDLNTALNTSVEDVEAQERENERTNERAQERENELGIENELENDGGKASLEKTDPRHSILFSTDRVR